MLLARLQRWFPRPNRFPHLSRSRRHPWSLERLEDRTVPAIAYVTTLDPPDPPVPLQAGQSTTNVKVWNESGALLTTITDVFPGFAGGCRAAVGDVTGDGVNDVVVASGTSNGNDLGVGVLVKLYDGAALLLGQQRVLRSFLAYNDNVLTPHLGGAFVAIGDTNGDGKGDIITGAADGNHTFGAGPHVKVFSGADNSILASFFAYQDPSGNYFGGGVNVAASDMGGDNGGVPGGRNGKAEIVTGVGFGGGPHVKVFDTHTTPGVVHQIASFFAYEPTFAGGVNVAAGFVTNNRDSSNFIYGDIVATPGLIYKFHIDPTTHKPVVELDAQGRPVIVPPPGNIEPPTKVFRLEDGNNPDPNVSTVLNNTGASLFLYNAAATFNSFPSNFFGGVNVTTADLNLDTLDDILVAPGPSGLPQIKAFLGQSVAETVPPAPLPTFTPNELVNFNATTNTGFPYFAYQPVFLDPPTDSQPNPAVTTGVSLG